MRTLVAILIAGGLALTPASAATKKHHGRSAGHKAKGGRRPNRSLSGKTQAARRTNKARTIPKSHKLA